MLSSPNDICTAAHSQHNKLVNLEERSRRNNLVAFGISETENETAKMLKVEAIGNTFKNTFEVSICSVECIRLCVRENGKITPAILEFYNYKEKNCSIG